MDVIRLTSPRHRIKSPQEMLENFLLPGRGRSLHKAVLRHGGIRSTCGEFLSFFDDAGAARDNGIPGVLLLRDGMALDELAITLHSEGHIDAPEPRALVDALVNCGITIAAKMPRMITTIRI